MIRSKPNFYAVEKESWKTITAFDLRGKTIVYAFDSKRTRDAWVDNSDRITRHPIGCGDVTRYASEDKYCPKDLSHRDWFIDPAYGQWSNSIGLLGIVTYKPNSFS